MCDDDASLPSGNGRLLLETSSRGCGKAKRILIGPFILARTALTTVRLTRAIAICKRRARPEALLELRWQAGGEQWMRQLLQPLQTHALVLPAECDKFILFPPLGQLTWLPAVSFGQSIAWSSTNCSSHLRAASRLEMLANVEECLCLNTAFQPKARTNGYRFQWDASQQVDVTTNRLLD